MRPEVQWKCTSLPLNLSFFVRVCNMKNQLLQNGSTKVSLHSSDCNLMKTKIIGNATLWLKCYRNSPFASYSLVVEAKRSEVSKLTHSLYTGRMSLTLPENTWRL